MLLRNAAESQWSWNGGDTQVVCDFEGAATEVFVRSLLLTMQALFLRFLRGQEVSVL